MRTFFFLGLFLLAVAANAQRAKDSVPISKEKAFFYKNYAAYLIKSKTNKPKISVDSSVYLPKIKQKITTVKSDLPSQEIKGTLSGKKQSVEITPDKPQPQEKQKTVVAAPTITPAIATETNEIPKQVKFIFNSTKTGVAKKTVDSSIYLPKTKQKTIAVVKTNMPSQLITGTLSGKKKAIEITPNQPQPEEKQKMIVAAKSIPEQVVTPVMQRNEIPKQVKFIFDSSKAGIAKKTVDSSVYLPKAKQKSTIPVIKTDLASQQITGTLTATKKKGIAITPGMQIKEEESLPVAATIQNTPAKKFEFVQQRPAKNPSATIDTNLINTKKEIETVNTDLKAQQIAGTLVPNKKNNIIIPVPATVLTTEIAEKPYAATVSNNIDLQKVKGDILNTYSLPPANTNSENKNTVPDATIAASNYIDPYANYTVPNAKANYKSQYLMPGATMPKTVIIPLSPDSVYARHYNDSLYQAAVFDSIANANQAMNNNNQGMNNNNIIVQQQSQNDNAATNNNYDSRLNTRYNFYVTQNGKFSVSFSTNNFYLNVNQRGIVADYGLMSNGFVTTAKTGNKVTQVGNSRVVYNTAGAIENIAGIPISYTFDGKVSAVGNTFITYNYEGVMNKVGETTVEYNGNFTVYRIGHYGISYSANKLVMGIDDSNGLIVFKPIVEK